MVVSANERGPNQHIIVLVLRTTKKGYPEFCETALCRAGDSGFRIGPKRRTLNPELQILH